MTTKSRESEEMIVERSWKFLVDLGSFWKISEASGRSWKLREDLGSF
jgi:hypothetical protein